jgi:hypothetical protein
MEIWFINPHHGDVQSQYSIVKEGSFSFQWVSQNSLFEFSDKCAGYGLLVILNALKNPRVVGIFPPP